MLILEVNDKEVRCPVSWEEATVKIFQNYYRNCREGDDILKVFCALTDTSFTAVSESTSEILEAEIYRAVAFVFNTEQEFRSGSAPTAIRFKGKTITIPKDLAKMTIGQNFHMRQLIAQAKNLESLISIATAVYLQPIYDKARFDIERAKEIELEILEMNIYDVFPMGFFLLSRLSNSGSSGLLGWPRKTLMTLNRMLSWHNLRALTSWRSLTTCLSLTATQRSTHSILKMFT